MSHALLEAKMKRINVVRLSSSERAELKRIVHTLDGCSQRIRRANILLAVDENGPNWSDTQAAEAYHCFYNTVKNVRRRFAKEGFEAALNGKCPGNSGRPKALDGRQEAAIIAMRLGEPPEGRSSWTLRLLAEKAVELEHVESICHETVRTTLKKALNPQED